MIDGDLRSAVHGKDATLLKGLELSAEQLGYLTHQGWAWMAPACAWWSEGEERDSLWCIDEDGWSMSVAGLVLATHETFDIVACQHEWSTKPARDVLHIWEEWADKAIESGDLAAIHRDAPRKAIEAKEAWCRGETDGIALDAARVAASAARDAAWSARDAAWAARDAARSAARSAWSARDAARSAARSAWSARDAARDAAWAARDAAWAARDAARDAAWAARDAARSAARSAWSARDAARDAAWAARSASAAWTAAYETYCVEFTAHVLTCIKDKKHIITK